jgi:hypothetical protein
MAVILTEASISKGFGLACGGLTRKLRTAQTACSFVRECPATAASAAIPASAVGGVSPAAPGISLTKVAGAPAARNPSAARCRPLRMDAASDDGPIAGLAHSGRCAPCSRARTWRPRAAGDRDMPGGWPCYGLARDGRALDVRACWHRVLVSLGDLRWVRDENRVDRNESNRKAWQITRSSRWCLDPGSPGQCRRDRDSCTRQLQQQQQACLLHGPKQPPECRQRPDQLERQ